METTERSAPDYRLIVILLSGAFVALLSNTFLNVALPSIKDDFGITTSTVQWVSTAYMLISGIVIPTTAFLMQRFSARNLFLAAMLLFIGWFKLPETDTGYSTRIDIPSVILSTLGFGGILYGFSSAGNSGWMFTLSSLLIGTMNMALFSGMILMPIYLQDIQGISPLETGLLLLPGALIMGFMSPVSGKLFDMFGPILPETRHDR